MTITSYWLCRSACLRYLVSYRLCLCMLNSSECEYIPSLPSILMYSFKRQRHRQNFIWVLLCAVVSCGLLYIAMGMIAYIQFGPNTLGDILRNFPVSDILVTDPLSCLYIIIFLITFFQVDVAKIVMAVHLVLAFPVGLFPGIYFLLL